MLALQPEPLVTGRADANNHGAPTTGEKRFSLNLNANGYFNLGERITGSVLTTDTGKLTS